MSSLQAAPQGWSVQPLADPAPEAPWGLRFFAAALLGRTPDDLPLGVRALIGWSAAEVQRHIAYGRASPTDSELALGLRLLYQMLKAEAAATRVAAGDTQPVLAAIMRLRHRQRAALLLKYGVGVKDAQAARALGVRPSEYPRIIAGAKTALTKAMARPVDVARALRKAGREPPAPTLPTVEAVPDNVTALPRAVMRTLLGPVPESAPATPPLRVTEPVAETAPTPEIVPLPEHRKGWSLLWRVAAAVSVGALFAWAVWPAH